MVLYITISVSFLWYNYHSVIASIVAQKFLSQWCREDEESHPALEVLKRLLKTSDLLSPTVCNYDNSLLMFTIVTVVTDFNTSPEGSSLHLNRA